MMRTLRDMNMSKFVAEDVPLFLSLIEDLFPGMKAERGAFDDVTAALIKVCCGLFTGCAVPLTCSSIGNEHTYIHRVRPSATTHAAQLCYCPLCSCDDHIQNNPLV